MEGFFHGTGHGLGLEIHEAPRMGYHSKGKLQSGHVVTIEPGLYYPDLGGVRRILKALRRGEAGGMLPDQAPQAGEGTWAPFFGRPAFTPRAPGDLALRTGAPVLVGTSHRQGSRPGDGLVFEATAPAGGLCAEWYR